MILKIKRKFQSSRTTKKVMMQCNLLLGDNIKLGLCENKNKNWEITCSTLDMS